MRADPRTGPERRVEPAGETPDCVALDSVAPDCVAPDCVAPDCGELFVLSAPSAAGKTTLIRRLFGAYPHLAETVTFSVSHTTRRPREGEVDGVDYHFVGDDELDEMVAAGRFLEWAVVHGRRYGTSAAAVDACLESGRDVILDIDVQGALQVFRLRPEAPSIFILPPSFEVLEERLRGRGQDDPAQIERRLTTALEEMRFYRRYDYAILNQDLDRASEALAAVILARRSRRPRMQRRIEQILDRFPLPVEPTLPSPDS